MLIYHVDLEWLLPIFYASMHCLISDKFGVKLGVIFNGITMALHKCVLCACCILPGTLLLMLHLLINNNHHIKIMSLS